MNDTFQVSHSHTYRHRRAWSWWDAKKQIDGTWKVHFHADYVASTDWIATGIADMFAKIQAEHTLWTNAVVNRDDAILAKKAG